jgi:hypothetical protein
MTDKERGSQSTKLSKTISTSLKVSIFFLINEELSNRMWCSMHSVKMHCALRRDDEIFKQFLNVSFGKFNQKKIVIFSMK